MPIKGIDNFRQKIPAFSGKKIAILPIFCICMLSFAFAVYFVFNSLPSILASPGESNLALAFCPLIGVLFVEIIGFFLVWQMWFRRISLKAKYGATSYQRIFLVGFAGVTWLLSISINQFFPFYSFAQEFWATSPLQVLATPLELFFGSYGFAMVFLKYAIALILLVIGVLMFARAIQVFGIDYMVVLYLYFPEESQPQQSEIYSVLRHPTYAGALMVCLSGAFFTFTIYSFVVYILLLIGFYIHIYFVEEKELVQRFGDSYKNYRKKVPAFFVHPRNLKTLFHFLLFHLT
jgi:protein-S-isoprenylcysteine O-methyltransferase Ste14